MTTARSATNRKAQRSASTLLNGLVAWWSFEAGNNLGQDAQGLHVLSAGPSTQAPSGGTGVIGGGAVFSRANTTYLDLPSGSATAFDPGSGSFTVAAWVQFASTPGDMALLSRYMNGAANRSEWAFYRINATGSLRLLLVGNAAVSLLGTATTAANSFNSSSGTWYLAVGVYDYPNAQIRVSLNAAAAASGNWGGGVYTGAADLNIGSWNLTNSALNGTLGGAGYWSRVLTQAEINTLYNSGAALKYPFATAFAT